MQCIPIVCVDRRQGSSAKLLGMLGCTIKATRRSIIKEGALLSTSAKAPDKHVARCDMLMPTGVAARCDQVLRCRHVQLHAILMVRTVLLHAVIKATLLQDLHPSSLLLPSAQPSLQRRYWPPPVVSYQSHSESMPMYSRSSQTSRLSGIRPRNLGILPEYLREGALWSLQDRKSVLHVECFRSRTHLSL